MEKTFFIKGKNIWTTKTWGGVWEGWGTREISGSTNKKNLFFFVSSLTYSLNLSIWRKLVETYPESGLLNF